MEFKVCNDCRVEKHTTEFFIHKRPSKPDSIGAYCKICCAEHQRQYRATKPKKTRTSKYTLEERILKQRKHKAKWKKNNKEKVKKYANERMKLKNKTDPVFKLRGTIGKRILAMLGQKKSKRTVEYVGCSLEQLKSHIEKQFTDNMTWENHGTFGWHVDHIKPLSSFDFNDPEQVKIAFHYTNLQPLWWKDNLQKSAKLDWKRE